MRSARQWAAATKGETMRELKRYALCLAAALAVAAAGTHTAFAAGIVLKNEMEQDIKGVYCVDDNGTTKQVTGALKAESSVTVTPDKLPEHECNRLSLETAKGGAWQFYHEPEPGGSTAIEFSMDKANRHAEQSYPSLLIENSGEAYVCPAGVPLNLLLQTMQFGLDEAKWKEIATPKAEALENPGAYAVSFADVSWSLVGDGLVFSELVPGQQLAESANMVASFSNATISAIFEGLKKEGATPWAMTFMNTKAALTKEGKEALPDSELTGAMDADESRWAAVNEFMVMVADSSGDDLPRIVFGNADFMFDLVLDRESGDATLTITRRATAAFG